MNGDRAGIRAVAFDVDGVLVEIRFPNILRQTLRISSGAASEFFDGPFSDCLLGKVRLGDVLPPYLECPGEIVLVDDQIANVEGARQMGWRAVNFQIGDDIEGVVRSLGLA